MGTSWSEGAVGRSPPRPDGRGKADGSAAFVDDLVLPGMWHGATVRCPLPAARIVALDASALAGDPEVVVVTPADLPGPNSLHVITDDWPVLAAGEARHAFEAVALVAAPTRERARRAAAAIRIEYEPLPAATDLDAALRGDPRTGGEARVLASGGLVHGDPESALAGADVIVEGSYETGHQEHAYIETQGIIAVPHPDGGFEILGSMQCPFYVHHALVPLFGLRAEQVRVQPTVTGGGFGGKEDYPDLIAAHAALLARKARRPVKIVYDRHEDILATTKRHPARIRHRTAVLPDGTLVAQDIDVLLDGGAYTTLSPVVLSRAVLHAGGPYRCPNVRVRGRVLATNTPPNGAFRGFGAPQVHFAVERQMDRIARRLGLDPLAVRRTNAYREGDRTPSGQTLDGSTSALRCLEEASTRTHFADRWRMLEAERIAGRPDDGRPWRGIGLSLSWHGAGFTGNGERRMRSPARVRLVAGGHVEVLASATDIGQGTTVVLAQIVAEAMGLPLHRVRVVPPDTAVVPDSGPTVASRTVMIVGGVLAVAGRQLLREVAAFVEHSRGLSEGGAVLRDGRFVADGAGDLGGFAEWADACLATRGGLEATARFEPRPEEAFDEATSQGQAYQAFGWGCDVVEVAVDPDTFEVRPERATLVFDVGRAIHPVHCRGQIEGGTAQALGWGHLEEIKMDGGRCQNDRLATYMVPTAKDVPEFDTVLVENPAAAGPFGAKGVGEIPMNAGAPALVQAIENATGVVVSQLPATPERLLAGRAGGAVTEGRGP